MSLAVVLHADVDDDAAVRQHPDIRRLVTGYDAELALHEFHRPVTALLRVERKSDADPASVRLTGRLPLADGGQIDLVSSDIKRGDIVAGVELQSGCGPVGKLGGRHDILTPQIERLALEFACNFVDKALDRKGCSRPGNAAIRTHRSLVGGNRVGIELQVADAIGPRQIAGRHARFLESARRPQGVGAGIDVDVAFNP